MASPLGRREADAEVRDFLSERRLVPGPTTASLVEMPGGVSSEVIGVEADGRSLVVKRSLPRLRVATEWPAKRERSLTEVAAMELLRPLTPGRVPIILAVDADRFMFAMERAPLGWLTWKDQLLAGAIDPSVAELLGRILGIWHEGTLRDARVAARFDDYEAFDQLRLDPYYRTAAARAPALAHHILWFLERMSALRQCLVHGDYSPKNVLLGEGGLWVVDYEVAHYGDPAFDLAFMLHHLLLKAVHNPAHSTALRACSGRFLAGYLDEKRREPTDEAYLAGQLACLLLARVLGKSPAEYLTTPGQQRVTALATTLLEHPVEHIADVWDRLEAGAGA